MTTGSLSTVYKADQLQRTSSMIPLANNFDRATSYRPPLVDSSSQRNEAGEAVLLAKGLDLHYGSRASLKLILCLNQMSVDVVAGMD